MLNLAIIVDSENSFTWSEEMEHLGILYIFNVCYLGYLKR